MTRIGRRGFFLKGVFGGVVSAGLVVSATSREIEAFSTGLIKEEPIVVVGAGRQPAMLGLELYNREGEVVAMVTHFKRGRIQVIEGGDETRSRMCGAGELTAVLVRSIAWNHITNIPQP